MTGLRNGVPAAPAPPHRRQGGWIGGLVVAAALVVVVAALTVAGHTTSPPGPTGPWDSPYQVDFDQASSLQGWTRYDQAAPNSNQQTGWWSSSRIVVRDGHLVIGASPGSTPKGTRIVSGGLGLYSRPQVYGKYEIRFRVDACSQVKYVLLLWPVSGHWPADGEIDFAEDQGGDRNTTTGSLVFRKDGTQATPVGTSQRADPVGGATQWHTFGVEWTPKSIRYTLDGQYWGNPVTTHIPSTPMAVVAQTEALVPASSVPANFSCRAYVQWVKQYAYKP